ncbi:ATP-binding protein [Virgibacillus sp. LDC-1]|uniref:sensor histidine kinase n=1 Tax=Virgibacillus sp. LDC-1 TaxID=3039856 RepID=UPI0024DEF4ED|nr:ATP-binding protein [Virgibacillus sp. LDC-1]
MPVNKRRHSIIPKGFVWRLSAINLLVITAAIGISGWAVYDTACFLAQGIGNLDVQRQRQFNATLLQYVLIFSVLFIVIGGVLHFYMINKLIEPIRQLIESTKRMRQGEYPAPVEKTGNDEVGQLVQHVNDLFLQLQTNEAQRKKLVTDLSHELRTPLANLNGYLQALEQGVIHGDEKLFKSLYEESKRLTSMVEQLELLKEWDYKSTTLFVEKKWVSMKAEIERCCAMFQYTLQQRNIPIEIHIQDKDMLVHIEGIQQILNNLLENAIHYYDGEGPIQITGESSKHSYYVEVAGPGAPIAIEDQERIFDRFFRSEQAKRDHRAGSGLGLAIAKEIVVMHGGTIGVRTEGNQNRFWFRIPQDEES